MPTVTEKMMRMAQRCIAFRVSQLGLGPWEDCGAKPLSTMGSRWVLAGVV